MKRKKQLAIEDKTEEARRKGRRSAEETAAADRVESDSDSDDDDGSAFVEKLHTLEDDHFRMFSVGSNVLMPCMNVFEVKDFKLGELYDQLESRNVRSQKPLDATQKKSDVFLMHDAFPESLRDVIRDMTHGPSILQDKFLSTV